jgi:lipopolysaccharide biosynthesis protein
MKHCIILHLYYQDLWPEFKEKLIPILNKNIDLYVSVTTLESKFISDIETYATKVFLVENRGADIGPFIFVYDKIKHNDYATYLKLHGKKTMHNPKFGKAWRQELYFGIVDHYETILKHVSTILGHWMLGNGYHLMDMNSESNDHINRIQSLEFIKQAAAYLNVTYEGAFFAGTMWLTNKEYLEKLFDNINLDDLYKQFQPGHLTNSLAHGMERVLCYGVEHHGGQYIKIGN